ncbi:MAG TPA: YaaC family protein, partial [Bacillales bacterium]|nr:YaaC family protein [Bacillales bacterium]
GVSARKKKKKQYRFFDDEVRVQKYGLVSHFSDKLFNVKALEGSKFSMRSLLERVPDLNGLFEDLGMPAPFYHFYKKNERELRIPYAILDDLHMTGPGFIEFLNRRMDMNMVRAEQQGNQLILFAEEPPPPFPASLSGEQYAPRTMDGYDGIPEMLVHFLLLYNLSMIGRYETEWWSELFHHASAEELPFITSFLTITEKKIPLLIERYLRNFM